LFASFLPVDLLFFAADLAKVEATREARSESIRSSIEEKGLGLFRILR